MNRVAVQNAGFRISRTAICKAAVSLSPRLIGSLLDSEFKQFVKAPHVLLRRFVLGVNRNGAAVASFRDRVFLFHFEQNAEKIMRLDHAVVIDQGVAPGL